MKRQATDWEKIFAMHIYMTKYIKEQLKFNNKIHGNQDNGFFGQQRKNIGELDYNYA